MTGESAESKNHITAKIISNDKIKSDEKSTEINRNSASPNNDKNLSGKEKIVKDEEGNEKKDLEKDNDEENNGS